MNRERNTTVRNLDLLILRIAYLPSEIKIFIKSQQT